MTSKERVMTILDHREADRVPLDLGGTNNTAMHMEIEAGLKEKLNLDDHGTVTKAPSLGIALPDQSIVDYFKPDTCAIYLNEQRPWVYNEDEDYYTDAWGIGFKKNPDGYYYNFYKHPLSTAETVEELANFEPPMPTEYMLEGLEARINENKDKCLILEGLRSPLFGLPSWLRGDANFYMDLLSDDGMIDFVLDKIVDCYIKTLDFIIDRIGNKLDIIKFADDLGTQESLLVSPDAYREHIKPRQAKLFQHAKNRTGCKILFHSCGAVSPLINDLIEIGVDALNPVQISAKGMEPSVLKKEFGSRITFWGGGIDTQHTLAYGTPEDIRKEVKINIEAFKAGGGYVFAQVHNIMPGVPLENVLAMFEAYKEYSPY